jgi:hypothetical protein
VSNPIWGPKTRCLLLSDICGGNYSELNNSKHFSHVTVCHAFQIFQLSHIFENQLHLCSAIVLHITTNQCGPLAEDRDAPPVKLCHRHSDSRRNRQTSGPTHYQRNFLSLQQILQLLSTAAVKRMFGLAQTSWLLVEKRTSKVQCSMRSNWLKLGRGFKILLENLTDALPGRHQFQIYFIFENLHSVS